MNTLKLKQEMQFQEQLLTNYEFYKIAFELSRDPKIVLENGIITRFNIATMKMFDCDDPDLLYRHKFCDFLHVDVLDDCLIDEYCSSNLTLETQIKTCKNRLKNVSISFDLISKNGVYRTIVTIYDISDRIKVKKELDNINEFVFYFMKNLPVGIAIYSIANKTLKYLNDKILTILEAEEENINNLVKILNILNLEKFLGDFNKDDTKKQIEYQENINFLSFKNTKLVLNISLLAIKELDICILVIKDVTKEYEEQKWLKLKRAIVTNLPNPIIITDNNGVILWVNEEFEKFYKYSKKEVIGKTPAILNSGTHDKNFFEQLWKTIRSGNIWYSSVVNKKATGELTNDNHMIIPIRLENNEITHFVAIQNLTREELDYLIK